MQRKALPIKNCNSVRLSSIRILTLRPCITFNHPQFAGCGTNPCRRHAEFATSRGGNGVESPELTQLHSNGLQSPCKQKTKGEHAVHKRTAPQTLAHPRPCLFPLWDDEDEEKDDLQSPTKPRSSARLKTAKATPEAKKKDKEGKLNGATSTPTQRIDERKLKQVKERSFAVSVVRCFIR
jgi:hypothetical protein